MPTVRSSPVDLQTPFEAAVVMPTTLRPVLARAVRSVFNQRFDGRIQILIGVDKALGDAAILDELEQERPDNCALTILDLGYSTSQNNGGLYTAMDGGAMRTILGFAANSRYVAYLDDDNWWLEDHLASLRTAVKDHAWAFSLRMLVDESSLKSICVDRWHSAGPGKGVFKDELGGFCDTNTIMIDKLQCHYGLAEWCRSADDGPRAADRRFFRYLIRNFKGRGTGKATVYYLIRKTNSLWEEIRRSQQSSNDQAEDDRVYGEIGGVDPLEAQDP